MNLGHIIHIFPTFAVFKHSSDQRDYKLDDNERGSDVDLFLLSQDIDSAIERFLPNSTPQCDDGRSGIPNDDQSPKEEFLPARLNEWEVTCSSNEGISIPMVMQA